MADINQYKKMKEKKSNVVSGSFGHGQNQAKAPSVKAVNTSVSNHYEEEDTQDYYKKIRMHRIKVGIVAAIVVAAVLAFVIYFVMNADNQTYSGYSIISSVTKEDSTTSNYIDFQGGYIRYSGDGISYYSAKGISVWNQTFQMKSPQLKICQECVAIGDINGSSIYIFNKNGKIGSVDTSMSISQIEVASQGVVAAVLEDTNANYINLYGTDGKKIYSVKTTLAGDGYPLDISISEDASKLVASYVYVSGESIKTNVVFYNFSDVGQNETERLVGGFNHYESTIVPEVQFMSGDYAVAVGEDVLSIYKIKEYPSLFKEIKIDSEIERVFTSGTYVGMILDNKESGDNYKLVVYNLSGNQVCETTFNTTYDNIKFDGNSIIMNNGSVFTLMNLSGKELAHQEFDLPINQVLSMGSRGDYLLVNSKYVQEIKLN